MADTNESGFFRGNLYSFSKSGEWTDQRIAELESKRNLTAQESAELKELKKWQKTFKSDLDDFLGAYKRAHKDYLAKLDQKIKDSDSVFEKARLKWELMADRAGTGFFKSFDKAGEKFTNGLNQVMDNYLKSQTALAAHLSGAGTNLQSLTSNLTNVVGSNTAVSQQAVWNNMSSLIKSGITSNVEQIAFMQTIADNIEAGTKTNSDGIKTLLRFGQADSYANRLSLEYALQNFLNSNYENSMYIKDAFQRVSGALTDLKVISGGNGVGVENTLQTWLGAYYSSGMSSNAVESIAKAFNQLGTGDISVLGSGIGNLLQMGIARAGLDIGDLFNNGITQRDTQGIMQGISGWLTSMGAEQNNVVRSQLAKTFGVSITDLMAAMRAGQITSAVSGDQDQMLADIYQYTPLATRINNLFSNFRFGLGMEIAGDPEKYFTYQAMNLLAKSGIGDMLQGNGSGLLAFGGNVLGSAINNANLLTALAYGGDQLNNLFSGAGRILSNPFGTSSSMYISNGSASGMDLMLSSLPGLETLGIEGDKVDPTQQVVDNTATMIDALDAINKTLQDVYDFMSRGGGGL